MNISDLIVNTRVKTRGYGVAFYAPIPCCLKEKKMKNIMNAIFWVPVILVLIGLSCVTYATWSWAGATAWCAVYDDNWNAGQIICHASVGWGGMQHGGWSTNASVTGMEPDTDHGFVQGSGGGSSEVTAIFDLYEPSGSASASIGGKGTDGKYYYDGNTDVYPDPDAD